MKKLITVILLLIIAAMAFCQGTDRTPKKLYKGWYTYRQLQRKGYDCFPPFKGSKYIQPTSDSLKVNIKPIK